MAKKENVPKIPKLNKTGIKKEYNVPDSLLYIFGEPEIYKGKGGYIHHLYPVEHIEKVVKENQLLINTINQELKIKRDKRAKNKAIKDAEAAIKNKELAIIREQERIKREENHEKNVILLKAKLFELNNTRELAIAEGLWWLNKWCKREGLMNEIYTLKNRWIKSHQHCLTKGQFVREEYNGALYCHYFDIDGKEYCFHAYIQPKTLVKERGDDLDFYGEPFNYAEFSKRFGCGYIKDLYYAVLQMMSD